MGRASRSKPAVTGAGGTIIGSAEDPLDDLFESCAVSIGNENWHFPLQPVKQKSQRQPLVREAGNEPLVGVAGVVLIAMTPIVARLVIITLNGEKLGRACDAARLP